MGGGGGGMPVLFGTIGLKAPYMESRSAPAKGPGGGKGLESVPTYSDWLSTMLGAGADFFFDIIEPKPPNMERRSALATGGNALADDELPGDGVEDCWDTIGGGGLAAGPAESFDILLACKTECLAKSLSFFPQSPYPVGLFPMRD